MMVLSNGAGRLMESSLIFDTVATSMSSNQMRIHLCYHSMVHLDVPLAIASIFGDLDL